ncbi:MAG: three-Cys-motif partner protein TcmP [Gammaproteobacteria bacterium]|nr:three-Cys-motif partner protein TcmP [Gammaproteobacteria bacterium]
MDKKGKIGQHSAEKLRVYREYIDGYLSVLTNAPNFKNINVIDLFAGMGVSENEKRGSALIAAELVSDFSEKVKAAEKFKGEKNLQLFLNEKSPKYYKKLRENLAKYSFAKVSNRPADDFVKEIFAPGGAVLGNMKDSISLFFIDPHGYTQLSHDSLEKIFGGDGKTFGGGKIEILLFVPTTSVYRFKKTKVAREFMADLGVEEAAINDINSHVSWAKMVVQGLRKKAATDFVFDYNLENHEANYSAYHLFFVSWHVKGGEKFLEARKKSREQNNQQSFLGWEDPLMSETLRAILSKEMTNQELYFEIIKSEYLPSQVRPVLVKMEKQGVLKVRPNPARRKSAYYLDIKPKVILHMRIDP